MARPLTEHSTKLRAGKGKRRTDEDTGSTSGRAPARSRVLEPVEGGRVRRIVFEGTEPTMPEPEPRQDAAEWRPRHQASMSDIEFEVDNLGRFRGRRQAKADMDQPVETDTVFETERGAVREARQGEKRVLYTSTRTGDRVEERRFSGHVVDEALRKRGGTPAEEEVVTEETVEYVPRTRRVVEEVVVEPKRRRDRKDKATKTKPKGGKAGKAGKAKPVVEPEPTEQEFQPQCAAVTKGGVQCRNSTKTGTRFCGSHQNHKARSLDELSDTVPRYAGAEDTRPGRGSDKTTEGKQAQCGAYTASGMQCRNSSRRGSKFCATHKGYRAPSRAQLEARLDTKPRHAGAKDTKPDLK